MAYDSRHYWDALTPPEFIDRNGKTHVGRLIGADEWTRMQSSLRVRGKDGSVDSFMLNFAMRKIVNRMFPPPPLWRRLFKKERSVAWHLWQMPSVGRMRAIWDFLRSQAIAIGAAEDSIPGTFPTDTFKLGGQSLDHLISGSSPNSMNTSPDSTTNGVTAG